jgi:thiamine-phosphate pyrophosphorylase
VKSDKWFQVLTFQIPAIYPITDARMSGLSHAEQVRRMIEGGATFIQLRDKDVAPREFHKAAAEVIEIARPRGVRIIINDRVDIALVLKADGVHLGQEDMPPEAARSILGDRAIIGFSTHSLEQVRAALKLPIDYVAFGPIFPTRTKTNADGVVGLEGLRQVRHIAGNLPLVAIGGITGENVRSVIDAGANLAAVIGAIVSDPDGITSRMKRLLLAT